MELSALSISLKISELRLECWNLLQDAFTALVVAGLIAEIFVVAADWHEDRIDFFAGIFLPPKDPGRSRLIFGLTGAILVAVGVGGELWTHQRASAEESAIQITTSRLVVLADSMAGDAMDETKRAGVLIAGDEQRVAKINRGLEDEKQIRGMMQYLAFPRQIHDPEGMKSAFEKLPKIKVIVQSYVGDNESLGICMQLRDIFRKANIDSVDLCATSYPTPKSFVFQGIGVTGPKSKVETAYSLGTAISINGRLLVTSGQGEPENSPFRVFVGRKPEAYTGIPPK